MRMPPGGRAAARLVSDLLPEIPQLLMLATDAERAAAWAEIEAALRQFEGADEFVVPHTFLIGRDGKLLWQGNPSEGGLERRIEDALGRE